MLRLTTPEGTIYIRKSAIYSISEARDNLSKIKVNIWVTAQADSFNIMEDIDEVMKRFYACT